MLHKARMLNFKVINRYTYHSKYLKVLAKLFKFDKYTFYLVPKNYERGNQSQDKIDIK